MSEERAMSDENDSFDLRDMKYKEPIVFNIILFALFLIMGGAAGLTLFLVYFLLYFFPGYLVLHHLEFTETEKVALAIPVSYSFTVLFFLLSRLGIKSVNIYGIIILYCLLGAFTYLHSRRK